MNRNQQPPSKRVRTQSPSSFGNSSPKTGSERYQIISKIGEGAYGTVYKARDVLSLPQKYVAVKKLKADDQNEGISATALREITILKELKHPNVLQLQDVYHTSSKYHLVLEWSDRDLKKYLEDRSKYGGLLTETIQSIMHQILSAIEYCHSRMIFHRDLKPQNILINAKGVVKVGDFGLARAFSIPFRNYTREVVTLWYRAPELLLGEERYALPIDMWSVGCIFAELCNNSALFPGDSEIDTIFRIFRSLGTPNETLWPGSKSLPYYNPVFPRWPPMPASGFLPVEELQEEGVDLILRMLKYNPANRISARAALQHAYFEGFDSRLQTSDLNNSKPRSLAHALEDLT